MFAASHTIIKLHSIVYVARYVLKYYIQYIGTGCRPESDTVWGIEWQFTTAGSVGEGKCPGLSESSGNIIHVLAMHILVT